jgi:hypothetical protein
MLSLVFVPAMFALMDDLSALIWRVGKRVIGTPDESEPARGATGHPARH